MIDTISFLQPNFWLIGIEVVWNIIRFTFWYWAGLVVIALAAMYIHAPIAHAVSATWHRTKYIFTCLILLIIAAPGFASSVGPLEFYYETHQFAQERKPQLVDLFSSGFDRAALCQRETPVSTLCHVQNYKAVYAVIDTQNQYRDFSSTYFIRLNSQGQIEKMFLDGSYKLTIPKTYQEKKVAKFLKSNNYFLIGAFIDQAVDSRWLNDWYSEAEVIVPVKINGETIGAIVRLFAS